MTPRIAVEDLYGYGYEDITFLGNGYAGPGIDSSFVTGHSR